MFSRPPRRTQAITGAAIVVLLTMAVGASAVAVNAFGAGDKFDRLLAKIDRFVTGPPPDRGATTVLVTEPPETDEPTAEPTPTPVPSPSGPLAPGATPAPTPVPTPTPTPKPVRKAVDYDIEDHPKAVFASEVKDTWCSPSGVQMALAVLGLADTSDQFQAKLQSRVHEWESRPDSHNGDWGPSAMALALDAYGAPGYEVRAYKSRALALRDAARAIKTTHSPVLLLAWRGAHTWVMTGYRADADPVLFNNAKVSGAYILDPWYPRISSIWGRSDPPGTFQDQSEMERNYLPWKRPEGRYPDRDGLFIAVVPTKAAP
jgi:hypothetical protein